MRFSRREMTAGLLGAAALSGCTRQHAVPGARALDGYILSYFAGGRDVAPGLRLAVSDDGLRFRPVRDGKIQLEPQVGEKKLMRDPFLMPGPNTGDPWHLLWTTAWQGVTLGHATSYDLVTWSSQRAIPVMADVPGTRNVWAPEMAWDPRTRMFVIFWSSTVAGSHPETANSSEDGYNHRLWHTTTRDFRIFTPPALLWDPGFSVIDATFLDHPRLGLHILIKDETLTPPKKHLRIARAQSLTGPFGRLSPPISPDWVEGPTAVQLGEWSYVLFDRYREGGWGAVRSRDLIHWEDASSSIAVPTGARHGTIVSASATLLQAIA